MSQPDNKRQKTSSDKDAEYTLYYWPALPGRGEFIRLLFEETCTPFTDKSKDFAAAPRLVGHFMADSYTGDDHGNLPIGAPPVLSHGDLTINQLPNILLYLAPRLGLAPSWSDSSAQGGASPPDAIFRLNSIALSLLDGLVSELHNTHHPIDVAAFYEDQKEEAKRYSAAYRKTRLPKWIKYAQRVLDSKASGDGPWLYGDSLTYVDLVLFQCVDGAKYAFPKTMEALQKSGEYDGVFKLYEAVKERPNIKAYLESDRRLQYKNGIWRAYPELEED